VVGFTPAARHDKELSAPQYRYPRRIGHDLPNQFQSLVAHLGSEDAYSGDVATRTLSTKPAATGSSVKTADNRDGFCCLLGNERRIRITRYDDLNFQTLSSVAKAGRCCAWPDRRYSMAIFWPST
jgi:hypothetical protein